MRILAVAIGLVAAFPAAASAATVTVTGSDEDGLWAGTPNGSDLLVGGRGPDEMDVPPGRHGGWRRVRVALRRDRVGAVPLDENARGALARGAVVEVLVEPRSASGWQIPAAGYRTFMRAA